MHWRESDETWFSYNNALFHVGNCMAALQFRHLRADSLFFPDRIMHPKENEAPYTGPDFGCVHHESKPE
jgi:hypothetical protein